MRKVAPSEMVREQIEQTLSGGVDSETNLLSTLAQLGMKQLVQQALEAEQEDFLGRSRYERQSRRSGEEKASSRRLYRNGYERRPDLPPRRVRLAFGCPRFGERVSLTARS